jgi:hypothetical protein
MNKKNDPAMEAYSAWIDASMKGSSPIVESHSTPQSPAYRRTDVLDSPAPVVSEGGWESPDGDSKEKRERGERNDEAYKKWKKSEKKESSESKKTCTKEEVEQVDEISKEKAGRYIRAAHDDDTSSHFRQGVRSGGGESNPDKTIKFLDTKEKRGIGIRTAVRKLTGHNIKVPATESVEPIEETPVTKKRGPVGKPPKGSYADLAEKKRMRDLKKKYPSKSGPLKPFKGKE